MNVELVALRPHQSLQLGFILRSPNLSIQIRCLNRRSNPCISDPLLRRQLLMQSARIARPRERHHIVRNRVSAWSTTDEPCFNSRRSDRIRLDFAVISLYEI